MKTIFFFHFSFFFFSITYFSLKRKKISLNGKFLENYSLFHCFFFEKKKSLPQFIFI